MKTLFGLVFAVLSTAALGFTQPAVNPVAGPWLHVSGNRIVDSQGNPVVLRGTQMTARDASLSTYLTATTFSQIRQRWNMNALRLQVSAQMNDADSEYISRVAHIVRTAAEQELTVILAAYDESSPAGAPTGRMIQFWQQWAAYFKDEPDVVFDLYTDPVSSVFPNHQSGIHSAQEWQSWKNGAGSSVGMQPLVDAIRSTGAHQMIVAMGLDDAPFLQGLDESAFLNDSNVVYEFCPLVSDLARDAHFGFLTNRVPLIANDWDLKLDQPAGTCATLPTEPAATAQLVKDTLGYFDAHNISWTGSSFRPGRMIIDFVNFFPTTLDSAWTCGTPVSSTGLGDTVRFHFWGAADNDVVTVNGAAGKMQVAAGGVAIAYGALLVPDAAFGAQPAARLGGASLEIKDSAGHVGFGNLFYVSPGSVNFVMPADLAEGVASLRLLRDDGVIETGKLLVGAVVPGIFTATMDARGPAIGYVLREAPNGDGSGSESADPLMQCDTNGCVSLPVQAPARIMLVGTGFRNAAAVRVTVGGFEAAVESFGVQDQNWGTDQLIVDLSAALAGLGEADLQLYADGKLANVVRVAIL